jgi:ABC-2 type transport system ATP-binding protein
LIQASFHEPDLLLLDEPTASLDRLMQEEFLAFAAEERERGVTVFFSSHELDEIERSCDRAAVIRAGSLIAVEDVAEVTRRSFRHVRSTDSRAPAPGSLIRNYRSSSGAGATRSR